MTDVAILCPTCRERLSVPQDADGKKGRCPCGAIFTIDLATMEAPPSPPAPRHPARPPEVFGPPEGTLIEPASRVDQVVGAVGDGYVRLTPTEGVEVLCYFQLGVAFRFAGGVLQAVYLYSKNPAGFDHYLGVIHKGLSTQSTQGDVSVVLGEPEATRTTGADGVLPAQMELAYPSMGLTFVVRGSNPLDASARVRHVVVTRPIRLITTPPIPMP